MREISGFDVIAHPRLRLYVHIYHFNQALLRFDGTYIRTEIREEREREGERER